MQLSELGCIPIQKKYNKYITYKSLPRCRDVPQNGVNWFILQEYSLKLVNKFYNLIMYNSYKYFN